jgi:hypothetical protein
LADNAEKRRGHFHIDREIGARETEDPSDLRARHQRRIYIDDAAALHMS